jgi:hypothetical protein
MEHSNSETVFQQLDHLDNLGIKLSAMNDLLEMARLNELSDRNIHGIWLILGEIERDLDETSRELRKIFPREREE